MKRIALALALATTMLSTAFAATDEKPADYTDKETYSCAKDDVEEQMTSLAESGRAAKLGINLLYIKSSSELSRKPTEVRCKVVAVYSVGTMSGVFYYKNEDGHDLVGFKPGATK